MDPLPPDRARALREAKRSILTSTPPRRERIWLHVLLFAATAFTTIWAGGEWAGRALLWERSGPALILDPVFLLDGLRYAIPFLLFLTVHEFGHYLTARRHRVDVSLPYFVPLPPGLPILNIGTFGAVIRIRQAIHRTRHLFDIGVAGPLAGFVVALGVLAYALITLPPPTYLLDLPGHEAVNDYIRAFGTFPEVPPPDPLGLGAIALGRTPLFWLVEAAGFDLPPYWEMYHYPVLFAGWLALFFTALNLLPVGQLDGGHVTYALFGPKRHAFIARMTVLLLLFSGSLGAVAEIGPIAGEIMTEGGRPFWLGPVLTWVVVALLTRWLVGKMFDDPYLRWIAWLGLLIAVAAADGLGGIAEMVGWTGWLLWSALIVLVIRVDHPPTPPEPLTPGRKVLGVLALVIFLLCFSLRPIYLIIG